jgi:hypothetical protein
MQIAGTTNGSASGAEGRQPKTTTAEQNPTA